MSCETFYVYMMTNKGQTTLYVGVTNSLERRVHQHRSGEVPGFTQRHNLNHLVYYESYARDDGKYIGIQQGQSQNIKG